MASFDPLDPQSVPPEFTKESTDWLAIFNPRVPRQMDVQLAARFVHDGVICSVKFSADGSLLAVGSDGVVLLYDLVNGAKITCPFESAECDSRSKPNHVRAVTISPDGTLLVAGTEDNLIRVFSIVSFNMTHIHTLAAHTSEVYALSFSASGSILASASGDRTIKIWSIVRDGDETKVVKKYNLQHSLSQSDSNAGFASDSDSVDGSKIAFTSVAIDSSERYVVAGSLDGIVRVWDLSVSQVPPTHNNDGESLSSNVTPSLHLKGHTDSIYGVLFISTSSYSADFGIVSASLDRTLKVWDVRTEGRGEGECVKTLIGHKDSILALSCTSSGRELRLASGSRDGSVRVWDLRKGEPMFGVVGHRDTVTTVDFSHDGQLLASGSGDREVRIWRYTIL
ncbi:hypothetical protein SERLA73DRAFT_130029 [Serpula lacrymans var. lacrymans S7.3]|uniref:Uncharacterized protein n=1 Tax=Serpula lacrymans var. lacrymans (strain S7.3) TaxID=936435 RepID=F8PKY6_SERL3|nr:hypothetical protein SERLA73DRAFT_130029 [Serpula lacrymans var. lacrymans S7.3]